jgi:hypothetical protein
MSYSQGSLVLGTTWTSRCDDYIAFFNALPGFALDADSGVGNARVLLFTMRGTNNLLRITYTSSSSGTWDIVTAEGAVVISLGSVSWTLQPSYIIIENTNLTYVNMVSVYILLGKAGSTYKAYVSSSSSVYYIHSASAGYAIVSSGDFPTSGKKTKTNKQIIIPYYPVSDDFVTTEDDPMVNVFTFGNVDALNRHSVVSIGGSEYLVIRSHGTTGANLLLKTSD